MGEIDEAVDFQNINIYSVLVFCDQNTILLMMNISLRFDVLIFLR